METGEHRSVQPKWQITFGPFKDCHEIEIVRLGYDDPFADLVMKTLQERFSAECSAVQIGPYSGITNVLIRGATFTLIDEDNYGYSVRLVSRTADDESILRQLATELQQAMNGHIETS